MALGVFVVGPYNAQWNSVALGMSQDGFRIQIEPKQEAIDKSDLYGDMLLDTITRGINYFAQMELIEYKAGSIAAMSPFATLGAQGLVGRLGSDLGKPLVLTAVAGTTASAAPATLTANLALLAMNHSPELLFSSRLRTVPLRMCALPYDAGGGGGVKNFVTT